MSLFQIAALLLLAANLAVLCALLARGRAEDADEPAERTSAAPAGLDAVIARAAAFLKKRLRSGEYALASRTAEGRVTVHHGTGHVFVAYFICEAMVGLLDEMDRSLLLVRILSEENEGVWAYSRSYDMVDADDSSFVFRALRLLGAGRSEERLLRFYREADRLFAMFDVPGATRWTLEPSVTNNFLTQPEVNANVFLALRGTPFQDRINYDMLARWQHADGYFESYFYPSKLYATLLVVDLLREKPEFSEMTRRALSYVERSQNPDGSWGEGGDPYETALAVSALAGQPGREPAVRRGVGHLLSTLAADGSWSSRAKIWKWIGSEGWWYGYDEDRAMVTACCLTALRRAAGHFTGAPTGALWKWTPEYQQFAKAARIRS